MAAPLHVTPIANERMCFLVASETRSRAAYRVDLLAHGGIGECHCVDWGTRRWPVIRDGGRAACKHVFAAREAFLNDLLSHMAKKECQP